MNTKLWLFVLVFLVSCGQDPLYSVDVQLAANQNTNPILDVSAGFESGQSRGVFFLLDPLSSNPSGINDVTGDTIEEPSLSGLGRNPRESSFSLDADLLTPGVLYRLRMVAIDSNGTQTHIGTSDCPVSSSLQNQEVTICFGSAASTPLCGGVTSFACCEGINSPSCTTP